MTTSLMKRKIELTQEENWKTVEEFKDYEISTKGKVRKWFKGNYRYVTLAIAKNGSLKATFIEDGTINARMIGKMVYETFLGIATSENIIYLDGDKTNCELTNLATIEELIECYKDKQEEIEKQGV